jgi:hypothetical protein
MRRISRLTAAAAVATAAGLVAATVASAVPPEIDLDVTASPPRVAAGSDVLIHAVITNTGGGTATNVVYRLRAPLGAVVVQASSPNGSCDVTPADVTPSEAVCNLMNLAGGSGFARADVRVRAPDAAGTMVFEDSDADPLVHLISVAVDEVDNDNPGKGGKIDTFFPSEDLQVQVRDDPDFAGGCLDDGVALTTDKGSGLSAGNPVITTTKVVGTGGLCTPYTIEEVNDPPTSTAACPPGARCSMPQYVDVLFPAPEPGRPVSITVETTAKTNTVYADSVLVTKCPRQGTITEGKCVLNISPLPGGGTEFTVLVASDIRLKG